ncbi:ABC transporter substrate-binding protein [Microlunatus antarcticus]|uniref:Glycine betaine/proline transport system substrate-binding protein n=1 Tax=Microlunatus antarcticus TaxID=53388 RepID=A0A7W5JUT8_9ACTN|nr:glycine betaine/proline transport system substrate-binding protein [Microlunatus antarcticus]
MTAPTRRARAPIALAALVATGSLVLTACGGGDISSGAGSAAGNGSAPACTSTMKMAVNPWVGYEASAYVVGEVVKQKLGCEVEYQNLKEEVSWQGFGSSVDVVIEDWGHPDLEKKYVESASPTAVMDGPNGNVGQIGWFVPPWMAEKYPDITDYKNLNKYAEMFKTTESGGQGQLLDGDPSYVTNDEALVKNLDLDYKVVYAGSEAALITAFRQAEQEKKPLIGYFYSPQWFLSEVKLAKVNLPPYVDGCDADPEKIACDYASTPLQKVVAKEFVDSGSPAYQVVHKFTWTNDDQNVVGKYIAEDKMAPEAAADKWIADNPDKVAAWLPA